MILDCLFVFYRLNNLKYIHIEYAGVFVKLTANIESYSYACCILEVIVINICNEELLICSINDILIENTCNRLSNSLGSVEIAEVVYIVQVVLVLGELDRVYAPVIVLFVRYCVCNICEVILLFVKTGCIESCNSYVDLADCFLLVELVFTNSNADEESSTNSIPEVISKYLSSSVLL